MECPNCSEELVCNRCKYEILIEETFEYQDLSEKFDAIRFAAASNANQALLVGIFYGVGGGIASMMSWLIHKSILMSILHGFLSWLYVIYRYFQ